LRIFSSEICNGNQRIQFFPARAFKIKKKTDNYGFRMPFEGITLVLLEASLKFVRGVPIATLPSARWVNSSLFI
jgi:hypothetical protein